MRKALVILLLFAATVFQGCNPDFDPEFLKSEDLHLKVGGQTILTYNPNGYQLGFNALKREFVVASDDMSRRYTVTLSAIPTSEGQSVGATVSWTTVRGLTKTEKDVTLTALKREGDKLWLWSREKYIEVSLRMLD